MELQNIESYSSLATKPDNDVNIPSYGHWFSVVGLLVKRDLKVRYRGSILGYLWSMLNPLLMMGILSIVFSYAMRVQVESYPAYVLSGIVAWNLFAQSINLGVNCFLDNSSLMKKVRMPAWVFPTAIVSSASIHAFLALIPYLVLAHFLSVQLGWAFLQLPIVFGLFYIFIEGIVLVTASLNVFFRDIGHVVEPILQIVFYATPIIYPFEMIPDKWAFVLKLNPLYYFMEGFRACLYSEELLSVTSLLMMCGLALFSLMIGLFVFARSRDKFLYYI